jgi:hypothetical protein
MELDLEVLNKFSKTFKLAQKRALHIANNCGRDKHGLEIRIELVNVLPMGTFVFEATYYIGSKLTHDTFNIFIDVELLLISDEAFSEVTIKPIPFNCKASDKSVEIQSIMYQIHNLIRRVRDIVNPLGKSASESLLVKSEQFLNRFYQSIEPYFKYI